MFSNINCLSDVYVGRDEWRYFNEVFIFVIGLIWGEWRRLTFVILWYACDYNVIFHFRKFWVIQKAHIVVNLKIKQPITPFKSVWEHRYIKILLIHNFLTKRRNT